MQHTGRVGALLLAVLLVSAGCSGLTGDGQATDRLTPAPVPESTPTDAPERLTAREVTDATELSQAHGARLTNTSFVLISNRTAVTPNGTLHSRLDVYLEAGASAQTYRAWISTAGPGGPVFLGQPPASASFWSDGETYLRRLTRGNQTVYNEFMPPFGYAGTRKYWIEVVALDGTAERDIVAAFGSFRTRVTGRTTVNGTTVYRVVGTDALSDGFVDDNEDIVAARNARLVANVTERGLVRSYRITYRGTLPDGTVVDVVRRIRYRNVGNASVTDPPWYRRAIKDGDEGASLTGGENGSSDADVPDAKNQDWDQRQNLNRDQNRDKNRNWDWDQNWNGIGTRIETGEPESKPGNQNRLPR
ncbi:MAG: hypothetical protein ABEJ05_00040 [Haloglomus sp.]